MLSTAVIVEDDPQLQRLLRRTLSPHGFRLFEAWTAAEGLREAEKHRPDIVLLDLGSLGVDGLQAIRRLREWSRVPILALVGGEQEGQGIGALDAGADDYLSKPFAVGELLVRVQVTLRRAIRGCRRGPDADAPFSVGELTVDLVGRRVLVARQEILLTRVEYRLLAVLAKNAGRVVPRSQLLTEVWGPGHAREGRYFRVYMTHLRRKLEVDPGRPKHLLTEPRIGYRLAVEREAGPGASPIGSGE